MFNSESHASEERQKILQMLDENRITAEQATGLLAALGQGHLPSSEAETTSRPRWLRVRVTDTLTGQPRASVTIPFGLVDWGLKFGSQFAPQVSSVGLQELDQALRSGLSGKIIDVVDEEDGEHVEIFVE